MFPYVLGLVIVALGMAGGSALVLMGIFLYLPSIDGRLRIVAILGWSSSAAGWMLLSAYLMAPIWFRVLVREEMFTTITGQTTTCHTDTSNWVTVTKDSPADISEDEHAQLIKEQERVLQAKRTSGGIRACDFDCSMRLPHHQYKPRTAYHHRMMPYRRAWDRNYPAILALKLQSSRKQCLRNLD